MGLLTRDAILAADDLRQERLSVPEWGGDVLVWGLSGAERDAFENSVLEGRGKNTKANLRNIRAKLVSLAVRDEQGRRLFDDADVVALGRKSARALDRVFSKAQELSGLSDDDVEELAKNSETGQNEGVIFDWPDTSDGPA